MLCKNARFRSLLQCQLQSALIVRVKGSFGLDLNRTHFAAVCRLRHPLVVRASCRLEHHRAFCHLQPLGIGDSVRKSRCIMRANCCFEVFFALLDCG